MKEKILTTVFYGFAFVGIVVAVYALTKVFEPVKPTDLKPIYHLFAFIGFGAFAFIMIYFAHFFKNLESTKTGMA